MVRALPVPRWRGTGRGGEPGRALTPRGVSDAANHHGSRAQRHGHTTRSCCLGTLGDGVLWVGAARLRGRLRPPGAVLEDQAGPGRAAGLVAITVRAPPGHPSTLTSEFWNDLSHSCWWEVQAGSEQGANPAQGFGGQPIPGPRSGVGGSGWCLLCSEGLDAPGPQWTGWVSQRGRSRAAACPGAERWQRGTH